MPKSIFHELCSFPNSISIVKWIVVQIGENMFQIGISSSNASRFYWVCQNKIFIAHNAPFRGPWRKCWLDCFDNFSQVTGWNIIIDYLWKCLRFLKIWLSKVLWRVCLRRNVWTASYAAIIRSCAVLRKSLILSQHSLHTMNENVFLVLHIMLKSQELS